MLLCRVCAGSFVLITRIGVSQTEVRSRVLKEWGSREPLLYTDISTTTEYRHIEPLCGV